MAIAEPTAGPVTGGKGLQSGALGLVGNVVIGLAAVAPAYSLAATLGYVVLAVGEKAPAMFVLAFIPMLLVAFGYKELSQDTPDCGTTFTWGTKAFGPWIGWIGGWGLAVSAIIVLANVAEVAAIYLYRFLGLDELAESLLAKVLLGSFFIISMTLVSARGVVVSERMQNVLITIQFSVLIIVSIFALIRVFSGNAGAQAITPQWSWLWPGGLELSSIAAAIDDESSPLGHNQDSCGMIACAPAVPANTRMSAMMLTMISTPNWTAMRTFCIFSETATPRALTSVMATMKKEPRSTLAQRFSARSSRPRNRYR